MIEYKDISFFNEYFGSLEDFTLSESFKEDSDKNIYVGSIEAIDSIHPLIIQIEIPKNFPHQKMEFWTESLFGYPHLISGFSRNHKGSWFCLNTPFAETPEIQLAQEMKRLRGWIKQQLREGIPAIITDPQVRRALAIVNAYDWEIQDENNVYIKSSLTFIGYDDLNLNNLSKTGVFHCVSNIQYDPYGYVDNECLFVIKDNIKQFNCKDIPYVIEERWPESDAFESFFRLSEFYNWSDNQCEKLLPDYKDSKMNYLETTYKGKSSFNLGLEAIDEIEEVRRNAQVPIKYKDKIIYQIEWLIKTIKERHDPNSSYNKPIDWEEEARIEYEVDRYYQDFHYFILGIKVDNGINWFLLITNHENDKFEKLTFRFGDLCVRINQKIDVKLPARSLASTIDYNHFFGRGILCSSLSEKKIAIIGAGAIGSIVAKSLAKGGFRNIEIWDNDTVEPGNLCRSDYSVNDLGNNKAKALCSKIKRTNPFCNVISHEYDLYGRINYQSQESIQKILHSYDLIIDCTASNELLHFMSYAIKDIPIISLSITNHAQNLLCISNNDGNAYAIRKLLLSKIEQDTQNFYVEGTGCYSPTFLASYADISSLVNLAIKDICQCYSINKTIHSSVWTFTDRGVLSEHLLKYKLKDIDIILCISSETLMDAEELADREDGTIGFFLGGYSSDGKQIVITHAISADGTEEDMLKKAFELSEGYIDYIGDYQYSGEQADTYSPEYLNVIAAKSKNDQINTNNPLLGVRNPDGSVSFFLYLGGKLLPFELES